MSNIKTFESMLEKGNDNPLLRYSLGNEYFKEGNHQKAIEHLSKAVEQKEDYSAAWKLYGKALAENGEPEEAITIYKKGIKIAEANGDKQAIKEMQVFLKRLSK